MIINTGGRTDTVQYFSEWLLRRFEEGYVLVRNPLFPHKVSRYELDPAVVDVVEFCSKNYAPILPRLHEITDRFNTHFQYTITAYGRDMEPGVPSLGQSVETLYALEGIVGSKRIIWRYDPVLLTREYTTERHFQTFEWLASRLAGHVDRCVFSFVEMYRKLERNMPELEVMSLEQMDELARGMGAIAQRHGLYLQTCATDLDYSAYGIHGSGCATLEVFGAANDIEFRKLKHKGMRRHCRCFEMRDIGAYDTCPNGCRYCYANQSPDLARRNFKLHDPAAPMLLGQVGPDDEVVRAPQKSLLVPMQLQLDL